MYMGTEVDMYKGKKDKNNLWDSKYYKSSTSTTDIAPKFIKQKQQARRAS